jgi:transglutaminase-like putative cysteine protease
MDGSRKDRVKQSDPEEPGAKTIPPGGFKSRLGNWQGWSSILLLFLVLEIAVLSLEQARWITPQPSLTLILVLAVLTVWLLVRSRLPGAAVHFLALIIGVLVTLCQAYILLPPLEFSLRLHRLFASLQFLGQSDGVNIPFAVFLALLVWIIGYVSAWFILRRRNAWVAVSLGAVVILVNLSNLPGKYYYFFGLYFLAAVILVAQTRLTGHHGSFGGISDYLRRGWLGLAVALLCMVILAVYVAWIAPEVHVPQLETAVATRVLWTRDVEASRFNPFRAVPAKQASDTSSLYQYLNFGDKWNQGEQVDFTVSAGRPSYWRVSTYDTYTSQGWTNHPTSVYLQKEGTPPGGESDPNTISYTVTTNAKTDALLAAGEFISADTPALLHVGAGGYVVVVTAPRILRPGEHYTVTSSVSSAATSALAGAGTGYPDSIKEIYLQLPPDFPESVRVLSESITAEAETPYDKVSAINIYLSRFRYEEEVAAFPPGVDSVEYFLFTRKSGFCLYFASAMAVMLRTVDVPTRLVVGYLPGEPGDEDGQYILRDKHYHTWPQAYFPGYGWVDLEATPSAEAAMTVSTPWVSDRVEQEQWDSWQRWGAFWGLEEPVDVTISEAGEDTVEIPGPWPFAKALGRVLLGIVGGAMLLFLAVSPLLARRSAFYRRLWYVDRSNLAFLVYDRLCVLASRVKLGPRPQQTPLEYATELASVFPLQAGALQNIAQAYVENRFGQREGQLGLFEEAELLKARLLVYGSLLARLGLADKLLHRWR